MGIAITAAKPVDSREFSLRDSGLISASRDQGLKFRQSRLTSPSRTRHDFSCVSPYIQLMHVLVYVSPILGCDSCAAGRE